MRSWMAFVAMFILICLCIPLAAIRSASDSIDVAVYHLTSFELAGSLVAAKTRGVCILVFTDRKWLRPGGGAYRILERHRIPIRALVFTDDGFMHKFAVFDERAVATEIYSWTNTAERQIAAWSCSTIAT